MSKIEVNTIETTSGSTLTIGKSGDTVTLASGATSSGFTSNSDINWQAVVVADGSTATTAEAGKGYFIDNSSATHTINLPASPSIGDTVSIASLGNASSYNITIGRNSSNIQGAASDRIISNDNQSDVLVYSNATEGWILQGTTESPVEYISATGGTETTSGDYKIHTFNSTSNFVVSKVSNAAGGDEISYLVVAGGAGGGGSDNGAKGGGGGAGGFREGRSGNDSYSVSPLNAPAGIQASAQTYPITVGAGGDSGSGSPINDAVPSSGSNSVFSTITSAGGGIGATYSGNAAGSGGSGGGGAIGNGADKATAGSGNTPPVSPPQGSNGGTGTPYCGSNHASRASAGGGGATAAGGAGGNTNPVGGAGGAGATTSISGSPTAYAGGGGGAGGTGFGGAAGTGGGGSGHTTYPGAGVAGTINLGGGGGAAGVATGGSPANERGGAGGSGVVILRYKYQ